MVTELELQQIANTPIPRRRFGTQVTAQTQQQALQRQQQARAELERLRLERLRQEQLRQQQTQSQTTSNNQYKYISKIANSSIPINVLQAQRRNYNLTREDINLIRDIREGQSNIQRYRDSTIQIIPQGAGEPPLIIRVSGEEAKELPPIRVIDFQNRQPITLKGQGAFEVTQAEAIQLQKEQDLEIKRQEDANKTPTERRLEEARSKGGATAFRSGLVTPAIQTYYFGKKVFTQSPVKSGVEVIQGVAYTMQGLKSGAIAEQIKTTAKQEPSYFAGRVAGEVILAGILGEISKVPSKISRFLREPINIDISNTVTRRYIDSIRYAEGSDIARASFKIFIAKPQTSILFDTRGDVLTRSVLGNEPNILFPSRRIFLNDRFEQTIQSGVGIVRGGRLLRPLPISSGKLGRRFSGTTLSGLRGRTLGIEELPVKRQREILEATEGYLGRPISKKNFDLIFGNKKQLSGGGLIIQDIFKINKGNILKVIPQGKRFRQAEVTSIIFKQKQLTPTIESIEGALNIKDVTFPKFKPTKNIQIKGTTIVEEIIDQKDLVKFLKPISNQRRLELKQQYVQEAQKVLNEAKAQAIINLPEIKTITVEQAKKIISPELTSYDTAPLIVGGRGLVTSKFYGTGQYERSESIISLKQPTKLIPKEISLPRIQTIQVERNIQREVPRDLQREIQREIQRDIIREIQRETQRQVQRQVTRQVQRQVPRQPPRNPPITILNPPRENPREIPIPRFNFKESIPKGFTQGFNTFIKSLGKRVYIGSPVPRSLALKRGIRATTKGKTSLSATFGIERAGIVRGNNGNLTEVDKKVFREFRIIKGKRINTPDVFIQRREKRLSTADERKRIQQARRISLK